MAVDSHLYWATWPAPDADAAPDADGTVASASKRQLRWTDGVGVDLRRLDQRDMSAESAAPRRATWDLTEESLRQQGLDASLWPPLRVRERLLAYRACRKAKKDSPDVVDRTLSWEVRKLDRGGAPREEEAFDYDANRKWRGSFWDRDSLGGRGRGDTSPDWRRMEAEMPPLRRSRSSSLGDDALVASTGSAPVTRDDIDFLNSPRITHDELFGVDRASFGNRDAFHDAQCPP